MNLNHPNWTGKSYRSTEEIHGVKYTEMGADVELDHYTLILLVVAVVLAATLVLSLTDLLL